MHLCTQYKYQVQRTGWNFVGAPAPKEADAITVDTGAEKRHGAAGAGETRRDTGSGVGRIGVQEKRGTNATGQIGCQNVMKRGGGVGAHRIDGGVRSCQVAA